MEVGSVLHESLLGTVSKLTEHMTAIRHDIHRHPELGLDLPRTQGVVLRELAGLGLEIHTGRALSSVTAVLRGTRSGPTVLLRADMDALPVVEATELPFRSENGAMHACGHDVHTAMLIGAAKLLAAHRDQLDGDVVFMFQPGEEGWDGASLMVQEGVLTASGQKVSSAYGMHVRAAEFPAGLFMTRPGTIMASSDHLRVTVRGAGGHASTPHLARDPIAVAAQLVGDLQTLVTRRFNIFDPVVITVGSFHAGTKENVIPDTATFDATVRSFSDVVRNRVREEAVRLCRQVAEGYGLSVDAEYTDGYPVTVNAPAHADFVAQTAKDVFGREAFHLLEFPRAGGEDFSRVLDEVPGCFLHLGAATTDDYATAPANHSSRATYSDSVIPLGMRMHAELAIRALRRDRS